MGFKQAKKQILYCLTNGLILHETRSGIDVKNLLAIGEVSIDEVSAILVSARGNDYSSSPHHFDESIEVHIVKRIHQGESWYIEWYFVDPNVVFISVHH